MSKRPKENRRNFLRQFRDEKSNELRQLTANQFMEIWQHYDLNSNGYLEGNELDMFLRELCTSVGNVDSEASKNVIPESIFNEFKEDILEAYDEDGDGRISVHELAEILPTEENFLLCFRLDNFLDSGDFMKIWIEFDKDGSGYIEINELKEFVSKLLENNKNKQTIISEEKLNEYTESILKIFDSNEDGRLQLSEMIKLLDERENQSLKKILGKCSTITNEDLDEIMMAYNMNTSDEIEGEELNKLAKDLLEITHQEYTVEDLRIFKNGLLSAADLNNDGKISKAEFKIVLMALSSKKQ